jgi:hypothetical protein
MAQQFSTFVATVARVNDKGFKMTEGDRWLNWSRFAGERTTPPVGAKVNVTLDGRSADAGICADHGGAASTDHAERAVGRPGRAEQGHSPRVGPEHRNGDPGERWACRGSGRSPHARRAIGGVGHAGLTRHEERPVAGVGQRPADEGEKERRGAPRWSIAGPDTAGQAGRNAVLSRGLDPPRGKAGRRSWTTTGGGKERVQSLARV